MLYLFRPIYCVHNKKRYRFGLDDVREDKSVDLEGEQFTRLAHLVKQERESHSNTCETVNVSFTFSLSMITPHG